MTALSRKCRDLYTRVRRFSRRLHGKSPRLSGKVSGTLSAEQLAKARAAMDEILGDMCLLGRKL